MDILVLSPWFPYPPDNGSRLRAFHLIRVLAEKGHHIRLVTGVQDDSPRTIPEEVRSRCEQVVAVPWRWYDGGKKSGPLGGVRALLSPVPRSVLETNNPPLQAAVATAWEQSPDAVLAFELGMDTFLPEAFGRVPVLLDQVEVSAARRVYHTASGAARLRHGITWAKASRYWRERLRRYDALTAVSDAEAAAVRNVLNARKEGDAPPVHVVPNGVDVGAYASPRIAGNIMPGRLIYNGSLSYAPNRDAVHWFVREILPRVSVRVPEVHLMVTGRCSADEAAELARNPRVHLTGYLPDLRPALVEAAACVVPLRSGGGTRLKILEAWAAGVPVAATGIGASGLEGEHGVHYLRADTVEELADATTRLLTEDNLGFNLARNARSLVEARYDWSAIGTQLSGMLKETVRRKRQIR